MASVERARSARGGWVVRYRDDQRRQRSQTFKRKIDADRFAVTCEADVLRGSWIDPNAGRIAFFEYGEEWRASQSQHRPSTAAAVESHLRRNAYPFLGDRPIGSIRPSHVRAWVAERSQVLAPATVRVAFRFVSMVFRAAVADRVIASNPCTGIKLPEIAVEKIRPLEVAQVRAFVDAVPDRYKAVLVFGAGTGVRLGEALGITVDRVDFLRCSVLIDRQLRPNGDLAPTKTKTSNRVIPLADVVVDALAAHLAAYPTDEGGFVFTGPSGGPIRRGQLNAILRRAVEATELPPSTGFHDLRHFYASMLIDAGESVKVVQERLGHSSAAMTLNVYSHLIPSTEERSRTAVEAVLGASLGRGATIVRRSSSAPS